jgi:single-strand DNA-binding protein
LPAEGSVNRVQVTGKVSRTSGLKYTPAGVAICDFTVAVVQRYFDKSSVGYFEAMVTGEIAENLFGQLKIGKTLTLSGSLWSRTFKDRNGRKVNETKILVDSMEENLK